MDSDSRRVWAEQFHRELTGNILPFWMRHTTDRENGGFYGFVGSNLFVDKKAPRAAVINARILWTFSMAARVFEDPDYRETADWAYDYIVEKFWDQQYGGVYWMVDYRGNPISDRKQIYAQAFAVYAFAEYFRATGNVDSLERAKQLYRLIEEKSRERRYGGYLEARSREWCPLEDVRLSEKDLNSPKSMNTHLHILEAYTNLLRVWNHRDVRASQKELLGVVLDRIVDDTTGHFKMFFDNDWGSLTDHISFGHDIEGSWLISEAAEALGDRELLERSRATAVRMAEAVFEEGLDADGSIFYEADSQGKLVDPNKHWWAQAEAVVGFYNAFQISKREEFDVQARRAWEYIEDKIVDRVHGEWHAKLKPHGEPFAEQEDPDACLVGPWKCPYHNGRVCFEMMARLDG